MYTLDDLQNAIAVLTNVDLDDPDIDQVDELIINAANKVVAADMILDSHEAGQISMEEANVSIAELITESAEADLDVFDLEIDLEQVDEDEDYSYQPDETASFSRFLGGTVSNLIAQDYSTPQDGKQAIAAATGLADHEIDQMIAGQVVPDQETAQNLASCFSATSTDQGFQEFMSLSSNALSEVAQFSNDVETVVDPVVNHKVNKIEAEFSAIKAQNELEEALRVLNREADQLVSAGRLSPNEKNLLFGKYEDAKDGLALFTAACAANNTPVETQVDRIRHSLSMADQRPADARFSDYRHDDFIPEVNEYETQEFTQAYITRNGVI